MQPNLSKVKQTRAESRQTYEKLVQGEQSCEGGLLDSLLALLGMLGLCCPLCPHISLPLGVSDIDLEGGSERKSVKLVDERVRQDADQAHLKRRLIL